jgi:hypothetical protein
MEQIQKAENDIFIRKKLSLLTGSPATIRYSLEKSHDAVKPLPTQMAQKSDPAQKLSFSQAAEKEPILNKVLDVFDGEIIDK